MSAQRFYFWKKWKNKNALEKRAIKSVENAREFLRKNVPRKKLVSVYIKGSFVTREMTEKSDVDIIPILTDKAALKKLKNIRDKNKEDLKPAELLPLSLTELKNKKSAPHSRRNVFLRDLEHYKLLYGRKLNKPDYPLKNSLTMFLDELNVLKNKSLPLYKEGKFGFSQLIKQVFWIAYSEQKMLGKNPPRTWKELDKFVKDKKHIIHQSYIFRKNPVKDKRKRAKFMRALETYLDDLNKKYIVS